MEAEEHVLLAGHYQPAKVVVDTEATSWRTGSIADISNTLLGSDGGRQSGALSQLY